VVRDEIVIIEPLTLQIVTVPPRSGGSTADAPAPARSKASFIKTRTTERQAAVSVCRKRSRLKSFPTSFTEKLLHCAITATSTEKIAPFWSRPESAW
jgi:hypothetical protein